MILRAIMLGLYARAWLAVPEARPLIRFYGSGYGLSVLIWVSSLAVEPPLRYVFWGIGLAVDLSLPPLSTRLHRRVPTSGGHAVERWGLFTIIVLGESVVVVALGIAGSEWGLDSAAAAVLGAAAIAGIWWLYFDRQTGTVLRGGTPAVVVYSYAHLPLLLGLAATSAGLALLIRDAAEAHLGLGPSIAYLGGVVLFLVSLVAISSVTVTVPRRLGVSLKLGAAALLLALLAAHDLVAPVVLAAVLAVVLAALVVRERTLVPASEPAS